MFLEYKKKEFANDMNDKWLRIYAHQIFVGRSYYYVKAV